VDARQSGAWRGVSRTLRDTPLSTEFWGKIGSCRSLRRDICGGFFVGVMLQTGNE